MSATPVELPSHVGRYQISTHLSAGFIDDVYKGFDPLLERPVVVRVFPLELKDEAARSRVKETFYSQMQQAGMLTHHGIATLFDAGEWDSTLFMANEFVDGTNLSDLLASRIGLDVSMRVGILAQIVDALEYAREAGVAHLHLRPGSVLVCGDFSVKLGGFGVAAVARVLTAAASGTAVDLSRYAPPEQLHGQPGDHRSDVFSLAVMALDLLAGESAAPRPGPLSIPPLPPDLSADGVNPERWTAVFERALAADPDDRFDTPAELEVELLLTLGLGAAESRAARETARTDALSVPQPAAGAVLWVPEREATTRTGRETTTRGGGGRDETRLARWSNPDASTTVGPSEWETDREPPLHPPKA